MPSWTRRFWTILGSILIKRPVNMDFFFFSGAYGLNPLLSAAPGNPEHCAVCGFVCGYTVRVLVSDFCGLCSRNVFSHLPPGTVVSFVNPQGSYYRWGVVLQTSSARKHTSMACNYWHTTVAAFHSSLMYDVIVLLNAAVGLTLYACVMITAMQ